MIKVIVKTEAYFENEDQLMEFIDNEASQICGFPDEIISSYRDGKEKVVPGPGPKSASEAISTIRVRRHD